MKMQIKGKRYNIEHRAYDRLVLYVTGPGLLGGVAIRYTGDNACIRDRIIAEIERAKENRGSVGDEQ